MCALAILGKSAGKSKDVRDAKSFATIFHGSLHGDFGRGLVRIVLVDTGSGDDHAIHYGHVGEPVRIEVEEQTGQIGIALPAEGGRLNQIVIFFISIGKLAVPAVFALYFTEIAMFIAIGGELLVHPVQCGTAEGIASKAALKLFGNLPHTFVGLDAQFAVLLPDEHRDDHGRGRFEEGGFGFVGDHKNLRG